MWYERLIQMLPFAHWPVKVQGIEEDMPSNMLSFINFKSLELYWTYFLVLQTTTPKIPPIRLMSLDHEPKMRCCAMSSNYGPWWDYIVMSFTEHTFWSSKPQLPKFPRWDSWAWIMSQKWDVVPWARIMGLDEIISPWVLDHGIRYHFCE